MAPDIPAKPAHVCLPHAQRILENGALGIGETHTERHGRELVQQLFAQGAVRKFFVELPTYGTMQQQRVDKAREAFRAGKHGEARELARQVGHDETPNNANPRLDELVYLAIEAGVAVIIADPKINMGSSDARVRIRNNATAQIFRQENETNRGDHENAVGSLLLFGSDHFRGGSPLQNLLPGLKWVCTSARSGR